MDEDEKEYFEQLEKELRDGNKYILTISKDYDSAEINDILNSFDIPNKIEPMEDE